MSHSELNTTHDPRRQSWVESANAAETDFPLQNLPYGVFEHEGQVSWGVAIGSQVLDVRALANLHLLHSDAWVAAQSVQGHELNALMGLEPAMLHALRLSLSALLGADTPSDEFNASSQKKIKRLSKVLLLERDAVQMRLPCAIGDYTDFLTSQYHTERHGRFKGLAEPLPAAFKHLPVAYHGRASSIRVSGTPVVRPNGQYKDSAGQVVFGPSTMLDFELELAGLVGRGNALGQPIALDHAQAHFFGWVLLNDWSAKSIQWWESVLGPFLGKSFMSSISPWIVTQEALLPFRIPQQARAAGDPRALPYLQSAWDRAQGGFDIEMQAWLQTATQRALGEPGLQITQTHLKHLYWTFGQMLTHHTSNGCNLRSGDLLGSGTVSGPTDESRACITEITHAAKVPLAVGHGETRIDLQDGDAITLKAKAKNATAVSIGFGECTGVVLAAAAYLNPQESLT
jgi:fumarylacetoacetase